MYDINIHMEIDLFRGVISLLLREFKTPEVELVW